MTFKIHPYLSYFVELASYLAKMKDNNRKNLAGVSKVLDFEFSRSFIFLKLNYIAIDINHTKEEGVFLNVRHPPIFMSAFVTFLQKFCFISILNRNDLQLKL